MSHLLSQFIPLNLNSSKSIVAANGDSMLLTCIGLVDTSSVALFDVYYILSLTMNLASISKICDSGCNVNFFVSDCPIYDQKTQKVVETGHRQGDLYVLDHFRDIHDTSSSSVDLSSFWLNCSSSAFYLWHSRCKLSKFSTLSFKDSISSSNAPFDLVHSGVWGPSHVSTKGDSRYYVSFINDFTHYTWVYLMKRSSHNLKQSELIKIDPFEEHTHVMSPIIPDAVFETPPISDIPLQPTTTTIKNPPDTIIEATSTVNQPLPRLPNHYLKLQLFLIQMFDPCVFGAMAEELTTLHQTHTWDLVPLPTGKCAIGSR
ncbi:hypothetical protein Tco_1199104 [Tanacetum coccineum]